jgi:hypothetical protein
MVLKNLFIMMSEIWSAEELEWPIRDKFLKNDTPEIYYESAKSYLNYRK